MYSLHDLDSVPQTTFLHTFCRGYKRFPILQNPVRLEDNPRIRAHEYDYFMCVFAPHLVNNPSIKESKRSHVYIAQALTGGWRNAFKIGMTSNNVHNRASQAKFQAKGETTPVWYISLMGGHVTALALEKSLHLHFQCKRIPKTEWFWLNDRDVENIKTIPGGYLPTRTPRPYKTDY